MPLLVRIKWPPKPNTRDKPPDKPPDKVGTLGNHVDSMLARGFAVYISANCSDDSCRDNFLLAFWSSALSRTASTLSHPKGYCGKTFVRQIDMWVCCSFHGTFGFRGRSGKPETHMRVKQMFRLPLVTVSLCWWVGFVVWEFEPQHLSKWGR